MHLLCEGQSVTGNQRGIHRTTSSACSRLVSSLAISSSFVCSPLAPSILAVSMVSRPLSRFVSHRRLASSSSFFYEFIHLSSVFIVPACQGTPPFTFTSSIQIALRAPKVDLSSSVEPKCLESRSSGTSTNSCPGTFCPGPPPSRAPRPSVVSESRLASDDPPEQEAPLPDSRSRALASDPLLLSSVRKLTEGTPPASVPDDSQKMVLVCRPRQSAVITP